MASFTDQIQQFNPYIQEVPIQEMVQVGMAKQTQYNQGVQKIQNYVDRVSGLEVLKPQHKQYLQSLMGELGNKLKTVAAGDFSNQQLVNSVTGMTGQVAKDSIIQNAVYSTGIVKKGYADIEAARKAGKSNKNNEDYYEAGVNAWMNDSDLKSPFQGRYTPYTDYTKKLIKIADDVKKTPSGTSVDNPFIRDDQGKTIYFKPIKDKDGKVIGETQSLDPSQGGVAKTDPLDMTRIKVKGVPAQQLYDTFNTTLDANDLEQMRIDSWAKFKGADTKTFQDTIINTYQGKKDMLNQQIIDLSKELQNPDLTSEQKSQGKLLLKNLTTMYDDGVFDKQMNQELATLNKKIKDGGLDEFKFNIYKEDKLTQLSKELSFKTYEEERLANPAAQANLARQKFQLDQWQAQDVSQRARITEKRLRDEFDWNKYVKSLEILPTGLLDVTEGTIGTNKKLPTVASEREDLTSLLGQKAELDAKWAKYLYPNLKNASQYSTALGGLLNDYRANPKINLNANQKEYLREAMALDDKAQNKINMINYGIKKGEQKATEKAAALIGDVILSDGNKFSASDVADVVSKLEQFDPKNLNIFSSRAVSEYGGSGVNTYNTFNVPAVKDFFSSYKGGKYYNLVAPLIKQAEGKATVKDINDINKINKAKGVYINEVGNIPKYETEELAKVSPVMVSQTATLNPDFSKGDEQNISRFLDKVTGRYNALDKTAPFDIDKVNQWWATRKSGDKEAIKTGWNFEKFEDGTAQVIISHGKEKEIIPVLPEDLPNYFQQATQTSAFNSIKKQLRISPNGTSNLAGAIDDNPINAVNAKYSGFDLPQLVNAPEAPLFRYDFIESPNNTGRSATDKYLFVGYVKDPKTDTWKRQELSNGYEGEGKMLQIMYNWNVNNILTAQKTWK